ncbi:MAG: AmmeMemoRadiSam system radical SAM enzyme [Chitinispirillaceae bacterium]|jgi:pyruvate formate lyase activating enzyme|nr:AmmeMemoRadiSam system radical SAM enzyme [Chitinispirillaceae bacterium]
MKEAAYQRAVSDNKVLCELCPHHCRIPDKGHGLCFTRENHGGKLFAANYCRPAATALDPIEKKPLFHFYPGSSIFSAGQGGCNFRCSFCQNFELSQNVIPAPEISPADFVCMIEKSRSIGIAYTYSEPIVWFETIMSVGALVRERGLKNVMVTNGFIEQQPLHDLLSITDAMNIDIKSMNPSFYKRVCKGSLGPVLAACEAAKKAGCHLEITHLLIPGENDDPRETRELADFIACHLGADTPLHISRYFPRFHMEHGPTPEHLLDRAWEIARSRLDYVYVGNIESGVKENTVCPRCSTCLIIRHGYKTELRPSLVRRADDRLFSCAGCGHPIAIIMPAR